MATDEGVTDAELLALVAEAERRRAEPLISYDMIRDYFNLCAGQIKASGQTEDGQQVLLGELNRQMDSCLANARYLNETLRSK